MCPDQPEETIAPDKKKSDPDCNSCRHYFLTHDPKAPYGCQYFEFKTTLKPCLQVQQIAGSSCNFFEENPTA